MKFNCGTCGEIDYVIVDGYNYGERILEGVGFEVRRDDEGKYHAQVEECAREYFSQFNQQMWLDQICEGMEREEYAICPKCDEEVILNHNAPIQPSAALQLESFANIITAGFGGVVGTAVPRFEPEVGDQEMVVEEVSEEEANALISRFETPSTEGGESGGGGASDDLGEPEATPGPEDDEDEIEEEPEDEDEDEDDDEDEEY